MPPGRAVFDAIPPPGPAGCLMMADRGLRSGSVLRMMRDRPLPDAGPGPSLDVAAGSRPAAAPGNGVLAAAVFP